MDRLAGYTVEVDEASGCECGPHGDRLVVVQRENNVPRAVIVAHLADEDSRILDVDGPLRVGGLAECSVEAPCVLRVGVRVAGGHVFERLG